MRRISLLLIACAALLVAGCGGASSDTKSGSSRAKSLPKSGSVDLGDGTSASKELPKEWPSDIKLPESARLNSVVTMDLGSGTQINTGGQVKLRPNDVMKHFDEQLAGWNAPNGRDFGDGTSTATGVWEQNERTLRVTATPSSGVTSAFTVSYRG